MLNLIYALAERFLRAELIKISGNRPNAQPYGASLTNLKPIGGNHKTLVKHRSSELSAYKTES